MSDIYTHVDDENNKSHNNSLLNQINEQGYKNCITLQKDTRICKDKWLK